MAVTEKSLLLTKLVPFGVLVTRQWLLQNGLGNHALDNLLKSGQLTTVATGVYTRPETPLKWQAVLSSLSHMKSPLAMGGLSALEERGFAHYVPMGDRRTIHLYGDKEESWINRLNLPERFLFHKTTRLFGDAITADDFTSLLSWGDGIWNAHISTPERAILEVLEDVPEHVSFEHAGQLMHSLVNLSPTKLDGLLKVTRSVKVKRLFFWFADRERHTWRGRLDVSNYDLGSGKRALVENGKLDKTYLITVPQEFYG